MIRSPENSLKSVSSLSKRFIPRTLRTVGAFAAFGSAFVFPQQTDPSMPEIRCDSTSIMIRVDPAYAMNKPVVGLLYDGRYFLDDNDGRKLVGFPRPASGGIYSQGDVITINRVTVGKFIAGEKLAFYRVKDPSRNAVGSLALQSDIIGKPLREIDLSAKTCDSQPYNVPPESL